MLRLEDLKPEHFNEITGQASQDYFREVIIKHPEYKEMICRQSIGCTGFLDNKIIGICGITRLTDYLGEGWAYFSEDIAKAPMAVIKAIKNFLNKQKHIRRIQCTVDVYNYKAIKFAKALGFKPEGILQAYGPEGHDHMMFTIIHRSLDWEVK